MKLMTKPRYFFGKEFKQLIDALSNFTRNVYDDLYRTRTEVMTALPTASKDYRGRFVIVPSSGVDKVYVCRKNVSSYEWKELSFV